MITYSHSNWLNPSIDYMWLHIRGVGEWTNTLFSYFEREQERLHNGEIMPYVPPSSSKANTLESKAPLTHSAPQKDFLRNLARLNHAPMSKASSLDNPRKIEELHECLNGDDSPALMHSENEIPNPETNPFSFTSDGTQPKRPPRSGQTSPSISSSTGASKLNRQMSETTSPIKKIQATLQRTFSRKGNSQDGYANDGYVSDEGKELPKRKVLPDKKQYSMALSKSKPPLEKSLSMPDIENRMKKRERLMAWVLFDFFLLCVLSWLHYSFSIDSLREYNRSESERSFDETQIKKARLQSLGLAYLSPQNKSLAQSFRYMRNKPTIIAFKTPSLENCEQRASQQSIGSMSISYFILSNSVYFHRWNHVLNFFFLPVVSPGMYTEKEAEEGKILHRKPGGGRNT